MIHQQALSSPIDDSGDNTQPSNGPPNQPSSEYGGSPEGCTGLVHGQVTAFDDTGEVAQLANTGGVAGGVLPVDVGLSTNGQSLAMIANGGVTAANALDVVSTDGCTTQLSGGQFIADRAVAVQFDGAGDLVTQYRQPSRIEVHSGVDTSMKRAIVLGSDDRTDTGFELFHGDPDNFGMGIACASCHPEGGDDGHVWRFQIEGARRTMSLAGDVTQRAPFHWKGDLKDFSALMDEVFTKRMGGLPQDAQRKEVLSSYVALFPSLPTVSGLDPNAVARGKSLFESQDTGCTACHSGSQLTTKAIVDVGTGGPFKVPSLLGLGLRAPYLHDGSAATLADRFGPAGGGDNHGHTSQLSTAQVSDLVSYLTSL